MRCTVTTMLLILISLGGIAQTNPIAWSWKAVRVDSNYFELHLNADIFRGWWLYKPNSQDICPYSPLITFERSEGMRPVEEVDIIRYLRSDTDLPIDVSVPPLCPLAQFSGSVTFIQVFRMPINKTGIVRGKIVYCAMSRYIYEEAKIIEFELKVGKEPNTETVLYQPCSGNLRIITTYPKGVLRKAWWFIRHPFGKPYIQRKAVP